ncbi:protein SRC1-like [Salvia hispanica]|uniref:protein SRC1-like n=1 Tax=Salvia hispanica TaxID=49212 RepID=UPI0020094D7A|nr:protein SRC1-like [Salvia hispanica]
MAGMIHKIEEKLGMGGKKEGEKHDEVKKTEHGYGSGENHKQAEHDHHKQPEAEHKEGLVEKIKDKIHGGDAEGADGKKKKKKKDKKKHGDDHGSSSSSDSD